MSHSHRPSNPRPFRLFLIILGFLLVLLVSATLFLYLLSQPTNPQATEPIPFTIAQGESVDDIATNLYRLKLIHHPLIFKLTVIRTGLAPKLQAGNFSLSPTQSIAELARELTQAKSDQVSVTLIEGWRREEMGATLASAFDQNPNFDLETFLRLTQNQEGYLYPDTYFFNPDASTDIVVTTLTRTFDQKVKQDLASQFAATSRSLDQIIILASILERESRDQDLSTVAGILWKRLDNNWPLQTDATLQYLVGYDRVQATWWPSPTAVDKERVSPFNTYLNTGLPPAPICNPSRQAILAALNPTSSDYWYYLTDNQGITHYAQTYDQHLANIQTYLR